MIRQFSSVGETGPLSLHNLLMKFSAQMYKSVGPSDGNISKHLVLQTCGEVDDAVGELFEQVAVTFDLLFIQEKGQRPSPRLRAAGTHLDRFQDRENNKSNTTQTGDRSNFTDDTTHRFGNTNQAFHPIPRSLESGFPRGECLKAIHAGEQVQWGELKSLNIRTFRSFYPIWFIMPRGYRIAVYPAGAGMSDSCRNAGKDGSKEDTTF